MAIFDGTGGSDILVGGTGDDSLSGYGGNDGIYAGLGDDSLYGGEGEDQLTGDGGSDLLYGGAGDDYLDGASRFLLGDFDSIYGGEGNDVVRIYEVSGYFDGGTGDDIISPFSLTNDPVALIMTGTSGTLTSSQGISASFDNFESVEFHGGSGNDTMISAGGDDVFYGGGGDNLVDSGDGNDYVTLGFGRNEVDAGGGDDYVVYNTGQAATLSGGAGDDTLLIFSLSAGLLDLRDPTAGTDRFGSVIDGFENFIVYLSVYDDAVLLGDTADYVSASFGLDSVWGGGGNDTMLGAGGADRLIGQSGADLILGGGRADLLRGGDDGDRLFGGPGSDWLSGGAGDDQLRGGADADVFKFNARSLGSVDQVRDFASGLDRLVIDTLLISDALLPGQLTDDQLAFGTAVGPDGQFVLIDETTGRVLYWDADGSGAGQQTALLILKTSADLLASDIWIS